MISSKELKYASFWANKTPMPGYEYSMQVLKDIKKCFESYKEKYMDKEYSIIFSNSEEIEFGIESNNLCHMLGIDYNNIKGDYFAKFRDDVLGTTSNMSSYQLLESIIENMEKVAKNDNNPDIAAKAINYYKSAIKCSIFNKLSDFDKFNFAAINFYGDKEDINYSIQKFLFVPSNEAVTPYFMMGIKKGVDDKYYVFTLNAPENPKELFENQEVIIPTQIMISDNDNLSKLLATPEEKIQLLTMYQNIINKYNIPNKINIYGDYESTLNDLTYVKSLKK